MSDLATAPARRIQRIRHELQRRDLEVTRVEQLSPNFVAVTLHGESLASFRSDSFDDHVKLFFGDDAKRDYTPRSFDTDRRELTLEFALHGSGAASDWARQAAVGQRLAVAGPRGSMVIPTDYDWHLLIGDDSALPAVHRRLEELQPEAHVIVLLQVGDAADRRPLPAHAQVQWVATPEELQAAVAALALPDGEGFAWAAGEASAMAALRPLLVAKGLPKEALKVAAYWKAGAAAFHETIDT
ncbi:siderophore-interacting protein [Roseateles sp. LYH14W]|uniref:Siderophore-interacting protein n=1 Tax=Pelomonas parva TaxID=3299032 RepID=A0ABW7F6R4_9BURK